MNARTAAALAGSLAGLLAGTTPAEALHGVIAVAGAGRLARLDGYSHPQEP